MYEKEIIKKLIKTYGLSNYYVTQCVKGKRENEIANHILKEYFKLKNKKQYKNKCSDSL